jgi:hypothetical protein
MTQHPRTFHQSYPEWIAAGAIVKAHAEDAWEQMLCEFSGSEIIYSPINVVAIEGLKTADTVALHLLGDIEFYDDGTALVRNLDDFSIARQLRALLGAHVQVECLVVADVEIENLTILEKIENYVLLNSNDFYQTFTRYN